MRHRSYASRMCSSKCRSPGGKGSDIGGNETFLDHVHPVIQGHQKLAERILQEIVRLDSSARPEVLTVRERRYSCARDGWWLDPSFFAMRDWNLAKTLYWAGKKDEALAALLRTVKPIGFEPGRYMRCSQASSWIGAITNGQLRNPKRPSSFRGTIQSWFTDWRPHISPLAGTIKLSALYGS